MQKHNLFAPIVLSLVVPWLNMAAVYAKPVNEAVSVVTDSDSMDANGVKLMVVCISLLVFVAFTLIGVTIFYFTKAKKKSPSE